MEDNRLKNKNYLYSWINAFKGIWYTIKTQTNIKIQLVIGIIVISACIYFKLNWIECMFLAFATMFIIVIELINTAIETVVDLYTKEFHPLAKIAKDVAAGAVVLSAINAVIIAVLIVLSRI